MLIGTDTNILIAIADAARPQHVSTAVALQKLVQRGDTLCFAAQNMREFWNVSTRPASGTRGFGLTLPEALEQVLAIEQTIQLLPDSERTYMEWRSLVVEQRVRGVQVHDAYLADFSSPILHV